MDICLEALSGDKRDEHIEDGGGRKSERKVNQVYASLVRLYSLVMLWRMRENEIVQQNEMSRHSESFRKTKRKCFTRKGSFLVYNPMRF